ncbi:hypothetical protein F2Q70_00010501 [Brassica cretica]|uniref:Uncharacterized protein n=1 Tax=Brassica cretica TaxID=69181 RepID=A0A3N6RIR4_BRACR|nr:hypothetical protein F2Q70_00010501 [Brassica cretica]KAF3546151.1 hypothetical protein DY000_02005227 [Brassica cretica]
MNFGDFAKNLCLSRSVEPEITENPFVFKPSEELSGSHVRRRCVSSSNHEFAGPSGFSDEKKSHHVPLPSLSNDQVNGSVSGSGSVSSVSSSGSGEDQIGHLVLELPIEIIDARLMQAHEILDDLLTPMEETHDVYKKQQLRELAFLTITTQRNV